MSHGAADAERLRQELQEIRATRIIKRPKKDRESADWLAIGYLLNMPAAIRGHWHFKASAYGRCGTTSRRSGIAVFEVVEADAFHQRRQFGRLIEVVNRAGGIADAFLAFRRRAEQLGHEPTKWEFLRYGISTILEAGRSISLWQKMPPGLSTRWISLKVLMISRWREANCSVTASNELSSNGST